MKNLIVNLWKVFSHEVYIFGTIVFVGVIFYLPQNPQRWNNQALFAFIGMSLIISYSVGRRFSWILAANTCFLLINGFILYKTPRFYFGIFGEIAQLLFPQFIAGALFWCLCSIFLGFWLVSNESRIKVLLDSCEYLFWLQILVMVGRRLFDTYFYRYLGAMDNESMDATLLLMLYCLSLVRLKRSLWQHLFFGIFIYLTDSTTAIIGLGLIWATWQFLSDDPKDQFRTSKKFNFLISIIIIGLIIGASSYFMGQHHFWNSEGRYTLWKKVFHFWNNGSNHWLGVGPGSFEIYGPGIGLQNNKPGGIFTVFIWMHNCYLQVLFEMGYIGLLLFLGLHVQVLYKSYKSNLDWLFLGCLIYSFVELTQMQDRHAPTSLIGVLLVSLVLGDYVKRQQIFIKD